MNEATQDKELRLFLQSNDPLPMHPAELSLLEARIMASLSRQVKQSAEVPPDILAFSSSHFMPAFWQMAASLALVISLGMATGQALGTGTTSMSSVVSDVSLHGFVTAQLTVEETNDSGY